MVFACNRWCLDPIVVYSRVTCGNLDDCISVPDAGCKTLQFRR